MNERWTPARIRARLREVLAEYEIPVPSSTICNRMPSCSCHAVRDQLKQLEVIGDVDITGSQYRSFYALSIKSDYADVIRNLWRREPVFTELRACR